MATIEKFETTDNYDPLHTLLNRPLNEIEALLTALENATGGLIEQAGLGRRLVDDGVPLGANFEPNVAPVVERRGDTVALTMSVVVVPANHISGATWRLVGTLPTSFRPTTTRPVTARSATGFASVEIRASGSIYIKNHMGATHPANLVVEFSDTYISPTAYPGA